MKQSSIEWFFEQLEFNESVSRYELLEQAKELHKQEMIEARIIKLSSLPSVTDAMKQYNIGILNEGQTYFNHPEI